MKPDSECNIRSYDWAPVDNRGNAAALSGLERLRASVATPRLHAPISRTLGFEPVEFDKGWAVFEADPQEFHYNDTGSAHGGFYATLLDSAISCAVSSALEKGFVAATATLSVTLVRPITTQSGRLRCEGQLVHLGRRVGHASGRLLDGVGRLCAFGSASCIIGPAAGGIEKSLPESRPAEGAVPGHHPRSCAE